MYRKRYTGLILIWIEGYGVNLFKAESRQIKKNFLIIFQKKIRKFVSPIFCFCWFLP